MKINQIKVGFGYRLAGSRLMKKVVISTLLFLPDEVVEKVIRKCWFVGSYDDSWAFVIKGREIKNSEYVIFLSDWLLKEDKYQIYHTIAHEIGHVLLGHRNSIGKVQPKAEVRKQEKEAEDFADRYLPI